MNNSKSLPFCKANLSTTSFYFSMYVAIHTGWFIQTQTTNIVIKKKQKAKNIVGYTKIVLVTDANSNISVKQQHYWEDNIYSECMFMLFFFNRYFLPFSFI